MHRSASQNGSAMNLLASQNGTAANGHSSPSGDTANDASDFSESRFRPKTPLSAVFAEHLSLRWVLTSAENQRVVLLRIWLSNTYW